MFISTHDSEFVRGILSNPNAKIKIFYLKEENKIFSCKSIEAKVIKDLIAKRSNLWTERILNSFFYKKSVLCEAEDDRVFFESATSQYLYDLSQDINFIGLNGKDEIVKVFEGLSHLTLDINCIIDFDYLKDGTFPSTINDQNLKIKYEAFKSKLSNTQNINTNSFKKNGIDYLKSNNSNLHTEALELINSFKKYKIFIIPCGEFESFTDSSHKDLTNALSIIFKKEKKKLKKFLKEIVEFK
jgi:hypothetical protein